MVAISGVTLEPWPLVSRVACPRPLCPLPTRALPAPLLSWQEGRARLPLTASGLVWLFIFLCVPADSRSSPLPVRAAAGLLWRFLKQ